MLVTLAAILSNSAAHADASLPHIPAVELVAPDCDGVAPTACNKATAASRAPLKAAPFAAGSGATGSRFSTAVKRTWTGPRPDVSAGVAAAAGRRRQAKGCSGSLWAVITSINPPTLTVKQLVANGTGA